MYSHAPADVCTVVNTAIDATTSSSSKAFSEVIDVRGWEYCLLIAKTQTMGADTITIETEFSATSGGSFAAPAGHSFTLVNGDDDVSKAAQIRLHGKNAFMRVSHVAATGSVACAYGVTVVLFGPIKTGGTTHTGDGGGKVRNGTEVGDAMTASAFVLTAL